MLGAITVQDLIIHNLSGMKDVLLSLVLGPPVQITEALHTQKHLPGALPIVGCRDNSGQGIG